METHKTHDNLEITYSQRGVIIYQDEFSNTTMFDACRQALQEILRDEETLKKIGLYIRYDDFLVKSDMDKIHKFDVNATIGDDVWEVEVPYEVYLQGFDFSRVDFVVKDNLKFMRCKISMSEMHLADEKFIYFAGCTGYGVMDFKSLDSDINTTSRIYIDGCTMKEVHFSTSLRRISVMNSTMREMYYYGSTASPMVISKSLVNNCSLMGALEMSVIEETHFDHLEMSELSIERAYVVRSTFENVSRYETTIGHLELVDSDGFPS